MLKILDPPELRASQGLAKLKLTREKHNTVKALAQNHDVRETRTYFEADGTEVFEHHLTDGALIRLRFKHERLVSVQAQPA